MSIRTALFAVALAAITACAAAQTLTITNPLPISRPQEVVAIPLAQALAHLHIPAAEASAITATDSRSHQPIPTQLYASLPDGPPDQLLLLVQLSAHAGKTIEFHVDASAPAPKPLVFGRAVPERKDDFAWENQQVAYRIYGPALQATGEISSGIDVWSKRIPNFVINNFYKRDAEGARTHNPSMSYHIDDGIGLDSYDVGSTRGCGGTAVFANGKLMVSKNYTTLKILADGPIRFSALVSYAPWDADGVSVSETKRITLDAGTHLNRVDSTYTFAGPATLALAAGIAVHQGANAEFPIPNSIASVWDTPQLASAGHISTGLIALPGQHATTLATSGHALLLFTRHSGETFSYLAGSGWSKADMPTAAAWNAYLILQQRMAQHPLEMRWSGH